MSIVLGWLRTLFKRRPSERILLGIRGERCAARFLKKHGYEILRRNFRTRMGEIDLIAREGHVLVFVEVKSRREGIPGAAEASVDKKKQRSLSKTALFFLRATGLDHLDCRFDVVTVEFYRNREPSIQVIKDAFSLPYR